MTTTVFVLLALSVGVCVGYILCAAMMIASEEQRREAHRRIAGVSPLEADSRF